MVQKLEAIKGGGGSIRVGTVGTISSLMTRELESSNSTSHGSSSSRDIPLSKSCVINPRKPRTSSDDMSTEIKHRSSEVIWRTRSQNQHRVGINSNKTPKRQKQKAPLEDVGNSKGTNWDDFQGKTRNHKRSYHIPMLGAENIHLEKTPVREKPVRIRPTIVEVVDVSCGNNQGASLSNRLKKLGFTKLSQSFM